MSHPRQHSLDRLIATLEETARIMWRSYEAHMNLHLETREWSQEGADLRLRCIACDERLERLKKIREGSRGSQE
jgi:hypothetical protein